MNTYVPMRILCEWLPCMWAYNSCLPVQNLAMSAAATDVETQDPPLSVCRADEQIIPLLSLISIDQIVV